MAITRSMSRRQNLDAYKKSKTSETTGSPSWSDLGYDLLFIVLMQLGPIDFFAFSGVCKSWRSFALSNVFRFMASRKPMAIYVSHGAEKVCYLHECDGRKFKTPLPHASGRICVGLTCGYLILFGRKTHDFWLVNPFTRHELHFPNFRLTVGADPASVRAILVFLPSNRRWVLVISRRYSKIVSFSLSSTRWKHIGISYPIHDLHFFQGKIYTLNTGPRICEMVLKPEPTLKLLEMNNLKGSDFIPSVLVSSDDNLFARTIMSNGTLRAFKVDIDRMIWENSNTLSGDYTLLVSKLKGDAVVNPDNWAHPPAKDMIKGVCRVTTMWYFPHNSMKFNLLQE